jgi:hypothetical protein
VLPNFIPKWLRKPSSLMHLNTRLFSGLLLDSWAAPIMDHVKGQSLY